MRLVEKCRFSTVSFKSVYSLKKGPLNIFNVLTVFLMIDRRVCFRRYSCLGDDLAMFSIPKADSFFRCEKDDLP